MNFLSSFASSKTRVALAVAVALGAATVIGLTVRQQPAQAQAAAVQQAPAVSVATVAARNVTLFDEFSGRVEAVERVEIRPRVSGTIERVHFAEGQLVKKGDVLFTIDPRPFEAEVLRAQANLQAERARGELARTQYERSRRLLAEQAVSQREFDEREQGWRAAQAGEAQAAAGLRAALLNLEYASVRAPVSGRVSRAEITTGNLVAPGPQVLTTVVSVSPMYVNFDMDERTYVRYAGQGARGNQGVAAIPVKMGLIHEGDYPREGKVQSVDNRLDAQSGTIRVRAVFDNADGKLTPGMLARVMLGGGGEQSAVLINDRAIGTDQAKRFVLVVGADNKLEYREVQPGQLSGGLRVVTAGLKDGEKIVVGGLQRVRPGMVVAPQPVAMDAKPEVIRAAERAEQTKAAEAKPIASDSRG
ncbi:RND transporter MFP subunit [beta proteobacterium AAP99]|nr:RND transporter MFP subunit [beta proteobacterium AAP99]